MESSRSQKTVSDHCLIWARPCEGSSSGAPAAAAAAAAGRWRCWSSNSCSIERVAGTVWQLCQLYQFAAVWHVAEAQGPPDCLWSRPSASGICTCSCRTCPWTRALRYMGIRAIFGPWILEDSLWHDHKNGEQHGLDRRIGFDPTSAASLWLWLK